MRKLWNPGVLAVCLAVGAPLSHAAQVLDVNAGNGTQDVTSFVESGLAQSFKTSANNLSGAGLLLGSLADPSGAVTISLWTGLPIEGGQQLATGTAIGSGSQWVEVSWNAVAVNANQTYYLVFTSVTNLELSGGTNTYAHGTAYTSNTASSLWDFNFRTYSSSTYVAAPVPEPETYAMLLGGLGLLGFLARRRTHQR